MDILDEILDNIVMDIDYLGGDFPKKKKNIKLKIKKKCIKIRPVKLNKNSKKKK